MKSHTSIFIKFLIFCFLLLLLTFPAAALEGASNGLLLWFHTILPTLFPFIVVSNLMVYFKLTETIGKFLRPFLGKLLHISDSGCYAFVMGFLTGYPLGAKNCADLLRQNLITKKEAQFLLSCCNNASPIFILSFICVSSLPLKQYRFHFLLLIYISAILSGLLYRILCKFHERNFLSIQEYLPLSRPIPAAESEDCFTAIDSAIFNSFETITKIGGYIILFSVIASILKHISIFPSTFSLVLISILEITVGIKSIGVWTASLPVKVILAAIITAFGGFSSLAQTKSVIGASGLSITVYLLTKLLNAAIAAILSILFVALFL